MEREERKVAIVAMLADEVLDSETFPNNSKQAFNMFMRLLPSWNKIVYNKKHICMNF